MKPQVDACLIQSCYTFYFFGFTNFNFLALQPTLFFFMSNLSIIIICTLCSWCCYSCIEYSYYTRYFRSLRAGFKTLIQICSCNIYSGGSPCGENNTYQIYPDNKDDGMIFSSAEINWLVLRILPPPLYIICRAQE